MNKPFVVIPAFNEGSTIEEVVNSAKKYVQNIIVVDDASLDNTYELSVKCGATVLRSPVNQGYDSSLEFGFSHAIKQGATSILTIDADGQHPFYVIPQMINLVENENYEFVIGIRPNLPRFSEELFSFFTKIRFSINDITCGMKCYKANIFKKYGFKKKYNSIGTYLALNALKNNHRSTEILINVKPRLDNSRYGVNLISELNIICALIKSVPYFLW